MNNGNYLIHYGVIGMKWGQRRLKNRIANAKSIGDKEKVKKLKKRYDENEEINKMKVSDKIFLSREGTLANQRLIAKGQSKVSRLMTLHGINSISSITSNAIGGIASAPFNAKVRSGEHIVLNSLAAITTSVVPWVASLKVRDKVYKELGN